jgi:hypothetical protein
LSSVIGARHPVGQYVLCAVELFERFAASLLGSLLLLYLNERLGLTISTATRWSGSFNAAVYLSSVLGGVLADRTLGNRRAVMLGSAFLAAGYVTLAPTLLACSILPQPCWLSATRCSGRASALRSASCTRRPILNETMPIRCSMSCSTSARHAGQWPEAFCASTSAGPWRFPPGRLLWGARGRWACSAVAGSSRRKSRVPARRAMQPCVCSHWQSRG